MWNLLFCSFVSFLIVSLTPFINQPDYSSHLTISLISLITSFEIISLVIPYPNISLWIAASANATAVNVGAIKTLLANGLSAFFIKGNPFLSNVPKCFPKNFPDCPVLCNWVFDNFVLPDPWPHESELTSSRRRYYVDTSKTKFRRISRSFSRHISM